MQKKTFAALLCLFLLALVPLTGKAENLFDAANNSGNFKIFLAAVKTAGLTEKLKDNAPLTIFAPTDAAFSSMPEGEWNAVLGDKAKLTRVLTYHMMPGTVKVTEVKPGKAKSAEGSLLQLKSDNGMVTVNGARVTESDIAADNGIIHAIDMVLTLPD